MANGCFAMASGWKSVRALTNCDLRLGGLLRAQINWFSYKGLVLLDRESISQLSLTILTKLKKKKKK